MKKCLFYLFLTCALCTVAIAGEWEFWVHGVNVQIEGPDVEGQRVLRKGIGTEVFHPLRGWGVPEEDYYRRWFHFAVPTATDIDTDEVEHWDVYVVLRLEAYARIHEVHVRAGEKLIVGGNDQHLVYIKDGPKATGMDESMRVPNDQNTTIQVDLPDHRVKGCGICVSVGLEFGRGLIEMPGDAGEFAKVVFIGASGRFHE